MADSLVSPAVRAFAAEPGRLGILGTARADGSVHLVPVGFMLDPSADVVRIITFDGSAKVRNAERSGRAAVSVVDGGRWATFEGPVRVCRGSDTEAAVAAYREKYRDPNPRADRVAFEIDLDRVLASAMFQNA